MKKIVFVVLAAQMLVGCAPSLMMKNRITFTAGSSSFDAAVVFKNTWPKCANFEIDARQKYNTLWHHCKLLPGHVPREIVIEYAPWLTYGQQQLIPELKAREVFLREDEVVNGVMVKGNKVVGKDQEAIKYNTTILRHNTELAIDQLPASSWKRIVLHPKETVSRWRWQPTIKDGKVKTGEIHYRITINPDNTHTVTEEFAWQTLFKIDMR